MMKANTHICFIVPGYPTKEEPTFTFVRQLITAIADLGMKCSVIAPASITEKIIRKTIKRDRFWQDITEEGNKIDIYQPRMLSFSNLNLNGYNLSSYMQQRSIIKEFGKIKVKPDILYAHFWDFGLTASIIGNKYQIPTFVATGESKIDVHKKFPEKEIEKKFGNIKGVIAVSTKNKKESIELNLATENMIKVIPNSIDDKLFYSMDKKLSRKKLGFCEDDFIVAFTGAFTHRKGVLRLSEALENIQGAKGIYIGTGLLEPNKENALHVGKLPHHEIPLYLNSADVFVLPTLAEGASNAIVEAMACGLPIVSSDCSFNDDILFSDNSIRIDPMDIKSIQEAILILKNNKIIKDKMSRASLKHADSFKITDRARKILGFMNANI